VVSTARSLANFFVFKFMPPACEKSCTGSLGAQNFGASIARCYCPCFSHSSFHHSVGLKSSFQGKAFSVELARKFSSVYLPKKTCCRSIFGVVNISSVFSRVSDSPRWEYFDNVYLLRPASLARPHAIVHFVGGAFVSSISQLAYRSLLEGLARLGYLVLVTPYDTTFDHRGSAESVNNASIAVIQRLKEEYGMDLAVVGLSHSLGCIIQILSTCMLPPPHEDVTKGHVFMAYNNKPLSEAVPLYKELLIPSVNLISNFSSSRETIRNSWKSVSSLLEQVVASTGESIRKTMVDNKILDEQLYPSIPQLQRALKQVDTLFEQVQRGRVEFDPSPEEIEKILMEKYARPSILIRCEGDSIDESWRLFGLLRERKLYVKWRCIPGTHLTPLEQRTDIVDDFLQANFQISSPFMKNSNLSRLLQVVDDAIRDILSKG